MTDTDTSSPPPLAPRQWTQAEYDALVYRGMHDLVDAARRAGLLDEVDGALPQLSGSDLKLLARAGRHDLIVQADAAGLFRAAEAGEIQRDLTWVKATLAAGEVQRLELAFDEGELDAIRAADPKGYAAALAAHAPEGSWTLDELNAVRGRGPSGVDEIIEAEQAGLLHFADRFGWRSPPSEGQWTDAQLAEAHAAGRHEEIVAAGEAGLLDYVHGLPCGTEDAAAEYAPRADDSLFSQWSSAFASGGASPEYSAAGFLVGANTAPHAVEAYARLGGAAADPNLAAWKDRDTLARRAPSRPWTPPPAGTQWSDADLTTASKAKMHEAIVEAGDRGDLNRVQNIP